VSLNPLDIIASRHKPYAKARERHERSIAACEQARGRVAELERKLAAADAGDRVAIGEAIIDGRRPPASQADAAREELKQAQREAEAIAYAEQRAAAALERLPREHKESWLGRAEKELYDAVDTYRAAISRLAETRDRLVDEATVVAYLRFDGAILQPLSGAIQRLNPDAVPIGADELVEILRRECDEVEDCSKRDPAAPQPEPYHLAYHRG
jgi:hypothetical protein